MLLPQQRRQRLKIQYSQPVSLAFEAYYQYRLFPFSPGLTPDGIKEGYYGGPT